MKISSNLTKSSNWSCSRMIAAHIDELSADRNDIVWPRRRIVIIVVAVVVVAARNHTHEHSSANKRTRTHARAPEQQPDHNNCTTGPDRCVGRYVRAQTNDRKSALVVNRPTRPPLKLKTKRQSAKRLTEGRRQRRSRLRERDIVTGEIHLRCLSFRETICKFR